jgi:hypothetical protein
MTNPDYKIFRDKYWQVSVSKLSGHLEMVLFCAAANSDKGCEEDIGIRAD